MALEKEGCLLGQKYGNLFGWLLNHSQPRCVMCCLLSKHTISVEGLVNIVLWSYNFSPAWRHHWGKILSWRTAHAIPSPRVAVIKVLSCGSTWMIGVLDGKAQFELPPRKDAKKTSKKHTPLPPAVFFGKPHWKSQMLAIPKELFGTLLRLSTPSQLEVYVTWRPVPRNIKWMHWWTAFARRQIAVSGLLIGILCISMPGYIWHRVLTWHTRSQELAEHSRCFGTPLISIRFWASLSVARWLKIPSYVCKGVS